MSLRVETGRPDIAAVLDAAADDSLELGVIGVFSAGPSTMNDQVHLACCQRNSAKQYPRMEFRRHAFEL